MQSLTAENRHCFRCGRDAGFHFRWDWTEDTNYIDISACYNHAHALRSAGFNEHPVWLLARLDVVSKALGVKP